MIYDESADTLVYVTAKVFVLANGGASGIYLHSSNPDSVYGAGVANAWRLGCRIANMEFHQFHHMLASKEVSRPVLLTETLRGEGALLYNANGHRFMLDYHADAELATRDVIARAIFSEMQKTGVSHVYLGVTHLSKKFTTHTAV